MDVKYQHASTSKKACRGRLQAQKKRMMDIFSTEPTSEMHKEQLFRQLVRVTEQILALGVTSPTVLLNALIYGFNRRSQRVVGAYSYFILLVVRHNYSLARLPFQQVLAQQNLLELSLRAWLTCNEEVLKNKQYQIERCLLILCQVFASCPHQLSEQFYNNVLKLSVNMKKWDLYCQILPIYFKHMSKSNKKCHKQIFNHVYRALHLQQAKEWQKAVIVGLQIIAQFGNQIQPITVVEDMLTKVLDSEERKVVSCVCFWLMRIGEENLLLEYGRKEKYREKVENYRLICEVRSVMRGMWRNAEMDVRVIELCKGLVEVMNRLMKNPTVSDINIISLLISDCYQYKRRLLELLDCQFLAHFISKPDAQSRIVWGKHICEVDLAIITHPLHLKAHKEKYYPYIATSACIILISKWVSKTLQPSSISLFAHHLNITCGSSTGPHSVPIWQNILLFAISFPQLPHSISIVLTLLKCQRAIETYIKQGRYKSMEELIRKAYKLEEPYSKEVISALGNDVAVPYLEMSKKVKIKYSSYFFGKVYFYGTFKNVTSMETVCEVILEHAKQIGQMGSLRDSYQTQLLKLLPSITRSQLARAMSIHLHRLCVPSTTYTNLLHINFVCYIKNELKKEEKKTTMQICHLHLEKEFKSVRQYLQQSLECESNLTIEVILEVLIKIVHVENNPTPAHENANNETVNMEFEFGQCAAHIQNMHACITTCKEKIMPLMKGKEVKVGDITIIKLYHELVNAKRAIICCSHAIATCYNMCEYDAMMIFIILKLSLMDMEFGRKGMLLQVSKMMFLQYLSKQHYPLLVQQMKESCERECKIGELMRLYMKWEQTSPESTLHKIIYIINQLRLIECTHTQKQLTRKLSRYVWTLSSSSSQELISNDDSLLPCQPLQSQYSGNSNKWVLELDMKGIIPHVLLSMSLQITLKNILAYGQKSQLETILPLASIYMMRSRNVRGSLLVFECMLMEGEQHKLNILSVFDGFSSILRCLYANRFETKSFYRLSNMFKTKRRSVSFGMDLSAVGRMLHDSLPSSLLCRQLSKFILKFVSLTLNIPLFEYFVKFGQIINKQFSNPYDQETFYMISTQQTADQILNRLPSLISRSYYHAQIVESYLTSLPLTDHQILELSILMIDFHYCFKSMLQKIPTLSQQLSAVTFLVQTTNSIEEDFVDKYVERHREKMEFIHKKLSFPVSILYPCGNEVANVAVINPVLVSKVDRYEFEDSHQIIKSLIEKNLKVLGDKNISEKEWWAGRKRVDREVKKIVTSMNAGVWDRKINQLEKYLFQVDEDDLKYLKFDGFQTDKSVHIHFSKLDSEKQSLIMSWERNMDLGKKKKKDDPQPLLLLLHPNYFNFPYEPMQSLQHRDVYRIPSMQYIYEQSIKPAKKEYNIRNTMYLANTGNDLKFTEQMLYQIKQLFVGWRGLVGVRPSFSELQDLLNEDVFLFMGHNDGLTHFKQQDLFKMSISCVMMLLGCSSLSICRNGNQPHGNSLSHLINGCPGILGCLWVVTDRDTDKLTKALFQQIKQSPRNLSYLLSKNRSICQMEFLNGAAIVAMGMPSTLYYD